MSKKAQNTCTLLIAETVDQLAAERGCDNLQISIWLNRSRSYVQERRVGKKDWTITDLDVIAKNLGLANAFALIDYSRGLLESGGATRDATNQDN